MQPDRFFPAKGANDIDMQGESPQPFRSSENVGYFHQMVIHHCSKMIRRPSIGFHEHIIVENLILNRNGPAQLIVSCRGTFMRHLETDYILLTAGDPPSSFIGIDVATKTIVMRRSFT